MTLRNRYLRPKEAAEYLNISPHTLKHWRFIGFSDLPFYRINGQSRLRHAVDEGVHQVAA
jgi:predicted site-specific integrase-resolvase